MKKAIGYYFSVVTLVLSVVALAAYAMNCGTAYFSRMGMNMVVMGCFGACTVCALLSMFLSKTPVLGDLLIIAAPVTMVWGFMNLVNDRVAGIASIFTFEMNAQNMSDLTSCLVALVVALLAVIIGIVRSFMKTVK